MSDPSPEWRTVLTPIEIGMQRRLFGARLRQAFPASDSSMWRVLVALRTNSELDCFRIWLIGSRVEPGRHNSDTDVVLSPQARFPLSDQAIERALWYCRNYGLFIANPPVVVDPCYRSEGPTLELQALRAGSTLRSVKLFSPKITREVRARRIRNYRRLGYFSIEFCRRAGDTGFYAKLPRHSFGGLLSPYLRPAIEVVSGP